MVGVSGACEALLAFVDQGLQIAFGKKHIVVGVGLKQAQRGVIGPKYGGGAMFHDGVVVFGVRVAL